MVWPGARSNGFQFAAPSHDENFRALLPRLLTVMESEASDGACRCCRPSGNCLDESPGPNGGLGLGDWADTPVLAAMTTAIERIRCASRLMDLVSPVAGRDFSRLVPAGRDPGPGWAGSAVPGYNPRSCRTDRTPERSGRCCSPPSRE